MSSKSTLFLTDDGDHWHIDVNTYSRKSTPDNYNFNVHISIGKKDIVSMEYCDIEETWFFEIDGDSDLAKHISKYRDKN